MCKILWFILMRREIKHSFKYGWSKKKKKPTPNKTPPNPNTKLDVQNTKSVFWHFREKFFCHIAFALHKAILFLLTATDKNYGTGAGEWMGWQGQPVRLRQLQAAELLLA